MREQINLNNNWKFTKDKNKDNWEIVQIPHTWNAVDGAHGAEYYQGACWYKRDLNINSRANNKRVYLEFNGSNSITDLYINNNHIGNHKGGYSTFRFDITEAINVGCINKIEVKVDNTVVEDVYPQRADFTFFGGIYRDVNIIITDNIHFDLLDYGSKGVYITQENITPELGLIEVKSLIKNNSDKNEKVRVWVDVLDQENNIVSYSAKEVETTAGASCITKLKLSLEHPHLWNGLEDPYLYNIKISIQKYNDTLDMLEIPTGLRFFSVDPEEGFFLNGNKNRLYGVSRHQDRKDKGWAISEADQLEDMEIIKEIGANSIRLAHYQHCHYFYDLCDKEGMVIWAEIPFITIMPESDNGDNAKNQLIELIRQNYNHPSIMFWGIQNEIQISDRDEVIDTVRELNDIAHKEDSTRLTTMANVTFVKDTDPYNYVTDIVAANKYYGWYMGKIEDFSSFLDGYHKTNPNRALSIAEYGAEGIIEYHTDEPKVKDYTEEYHALYHEKVWEIMNTRDYLWSTYVWNMFDFAANIRDEGGVKGRNNKGLVTYDRKIKKDAFYLYKAYWSKNPFIHICGKRYIDRPTESVNIKVYSNCENLKLYINDDVVNAVTTNGRVHIFNSVKLSLGINNIVVKGITKGSEYSDKVLFNRVESENLSYKCAEDGAGDNVKNWFENREDVSHVEVSDLEIPDGVYSSKCTYREILENEETKKIMRKYMGSIDEHPMFKMVMDMTVDKAASMDSDPETSKRVFMMNKELILINKV